MEEIIRAHLICENIRDFRKLPEVSFVSVSHDLNFTVGVFDVMEKFWKEREKIYYLNALFVCSNNTTTTNNNKAFNPK
jgi:hypothetical protein